MKKIIFTLSGLAFCLVVNAQTVMTENWPNGNVKFKGTVIGDAKIATSDSKEAQARKMDNVIKDGKWSTFYENGTVRSEEFYDKGTMIGNWKVMYDNGKVESDINFKTGQATYYTKTGSVSSKGGIAPGMINTGNWIGYFENGNMNYEGTYNAQGQKNGVWKWFDEKGNATTEQTFANGNMLSSKDLTKK